MDARNHIRILVVWFDCFAADLLDQLEQIFERVISQADNRESRATVGFLAEQRDRELFDRQRIEVNCLLVLIITLFASFVGLRIRKQGLVVNNKLTFGRRCVRIGISLDRNGIHVVRREQAFH